MARSQYQRLHPCAMCTCESECASNDWCLYDHRNKKCPNYKEGVKQYKRDRKLFLKGLL